MRRVVRAAVAAAVAAGATVALAGPAGAIIDELVLDPTSGPVGTQVAIEGALGCPGQADGSDVLVRFVDTDAGPQTGTNLGTTTWSSSGAFATTVTIPSEMGQLIIGEGITMVPVTPGSAYAIEVQCSFSETTPNDVEAPFTVTEDPTTTTTSTSTTSTTAPSTTTTADGTSPTVPPTPPADAGPLTGLSTRVVAPGGSITIDEGGFTPGTTVDVVLYSTPAVLSANVPVDVDGHVRTTVRIPTDTAPGDHTLVLYGEPQAKAGTIQVSGPPASAVGANLPVTGSADTGWMVAVGAGLLAAGAAAAAAARRTRATR